MKFVIQRVTGASVTVDNEIIGKIGKGFLVLIGISQTDTKEIADKLIRKMTGLRIFDDENGKTNLAPMSAEACFLSHSSRCTLIAAKVTAPPLQEPAHPIWQTSCTSISLSNAGSVKA